MNKLVFIIIAVIFVGCNMDSINRKSQSNIDRFFAGIKEGKYEETLDQFLKSNNNINQEDTITLDLKHKFNTINQYSGKYIGYSLIKKRNLGNDVIVYSYLVKYEKKFYRFVFTFYNVNETPIIYKFVFDDNLDLELEESLKLYIN